MFYFIATANLHIPWYLWHPVSAVNVANHFFSPQYVVSEDLQTFVLVGRAKTNLQCRISKLVQGLALQVFLSGHIKFIRLSVSVVRVVCQMRWYFLKNLKRSNRHWNYFLVIGGTIYSNLSFIFQRFLNTLHTNKVVGTWFFPWALFPISCLT